MSSGETEFRAGMFVRGRYTPRIFKLVKPIDSETWLAEPISYEDKVLIYIKNCVPVEDDFTLWVEDVRREG